MQASVRNSVVMAFIVLLHGAGVLALAQVKARSSTELPPAPITARIISSPYEKEAAPVLPPVHMTVPRLTLEPPILPDFDARTVEESPSAISVSMHAAQQVSSGPVAERHAPKLISSVEYVREPVPKYPPQSRKLREQGLVMLRVLIDENGNACSIEVAASSGHARLDQAAREAVARAAFRPYVEDGEPRRAVVLIPIEFYLNRTSA